MMKSASPELLALFATNKEFQQCDLYTFTLTSGFILRYAACSFDVVHGGVSWLCARTVGGVVIDSADDNSGPRGHWTKGLDVGQWSVQVMPRPTDLIGDNNWLWAVRAGILAEATVVVDRAYFYEWPLMPTIALAPIGTINIFSGRVAEIDLGRSAVQINMNDPRELLTINMPRNLYTGQCRLALFDTVCGLNKDNFQTVVNVIGVNENNLQLSASLPDGFLSLGNIVFTSGKNTRLRMMVRSQAADQIQMIAPMPFDVEVGDTAVVYPGCDKQMATCQNKFNNLANYGGAPFIPAAETAV